MGSLISEYAKAAHDPAVCQELVRRITQTLDGRPFNFMEVCGTHTTALFQSGARSLLPKNIKHVSGPGCPVCVTHESEAALFLDLASQKNITITTYGDLLRIPGPDGKSLKNMQGEGAKVRIVYSALDAVNYAKSNPDEEVVFISVGFETTAPGMAAAILTAKQAAVHNFSALILHKLTPPVLRYLAEQKDCNIDAFLLPGHVATIIGVKPFAFLADQYNLPAVVGGFEPAELLQAIYELARQSNSARAEIDNAYPRAVKAEGNLRALQLMNDVFEKTEGLWRGMGKIAASGLRLRDAFGEFDAMKKFGLALQPLESIAGCQCGKILKGVLSPLQCPLFGKKCTPAAPVGPCMVSTEGSCAAYYRYGAN